MSDYSPLRWYTGALRVPTFIGKLPSGEHLYGGPYTATQGITFVTVLVTGLLTRTLWSGLIPSNALGSLMQYAVILAVAIAATIAVRYTPTTAMNPLGIAVGVTKLITHRRPSPVGSKARAMRGRITVHGTTPPTHHHHPTITENASTPPTTPRAPVPDSGVEAKLVALLEQNRSGSHV